MKRIRRIIRALDPKADATMGQRERLEAFRIRRAAALVLVLFLLIASMTSCSVHALLVRMTPNTQTTAQATHSTSAKKTAKTNQHKTAKKTKPETKQSQEEQAVAKAVSAQSAALSDDEKTAILNKAQETAQNSGKPVTQYHYCIATKGNVGSADEFGNAAFRILEEPLLVTGIGVAFALNDTRGLDEQLTKTFAAMRADGTMKQIVGKYLPDPEKYLEVDALEP